MFRHSNIPIDELSYGFTSYREISTSAINPEEDFNVSFLVHFIRNNPIKHSAKWEHLAERITVEEEQIDL